MLCTEVKIRTFFFGGNIMPNSSLGAVILQVEEVVGLCEISIKERVRLK